MTNIKVKEITYGQYGKCVEISNGSVELVATLDMGPRIIRYGFPGKANMFCNNTESVYEKTGWKILGGHRLWISPEHEILSYEPDNSPIKYEEVPGGIHLIGNPEKSTGLTKEIYIILEEEGSNVSVRHLITNNNLWPVEFAAWSLSVMAPGGVEVVPVNQKDTGLLGNRWLALWPYAKMNDSRVWWGEKYITLKSVEGAESKFKFGITNPLGWAAYFNNNMAFVKQFKYMDGCAYPDSGMNYETFTNDFMLEMESLSPITYVKTGQSVVHIECWSLIDNVSMPENDDKTIDELLGDTMPGFVNSSSQGCGCGCDCGCDCDDDCDDDCDCGCDCDCEDDHDDGCGCGCGDTGCCC